MAVRQEARFHLTMLLAQHSHRAANLFDRQFHHEQRVRSSNRVEMQEINTFWENELRCVSPRASRQAASLPTDQGIDAWLDRFYQNVLSDVVFRWNKPSAHGTL